MKRTYPNCVASNKNPQHVCELRYAPRLASGAVGSVRPAPGGLPRRALGGPTRSAAKSPRERQPSGTAMMTTTATMMMMTTMMMYGSTFHSYRLHASAYGKLMAPRLSAVANISRSRATGKNVGTFLVPALFDAAAARERTLTCRSCSARTSASRPTQQHLNDGCGCCWAVPGLPGGTHHKAQWPAPPPAPPSEPMPPTRPPWAETWRQTARERARRDAYAPR
jgi:hypothetical protein